MASRVLLTAATVLVSLVVAAHAHEWGLGSCRTVQPIPNLAVEKFLGVWYVIEQFDTGSRCLLLNYTRVSETQLKVTKLRQFHMLDRVGIDHTNSYTGTLDMPYGDDLARLRVKWPLNIAGKGDYVVFDTDYTTYAGIYECQDITSLMHRRSAAILSRSPTLSEEFVDRVKRRLRSYGIDTDDFDEIEHQGCRTRAEADINIHVDSDTFRKVMSGTRTRIEDVATTIVQGIRDLASTVSQASQDTISSIQGTAQTAFSDPPSTVETVGVALETNLKPVVENVGIGIRANAEDNFEKFEKAIDVAVEKADETIKEINEFVNENVDSGLRDVNNFASETDNDIVDKTINFNTADETVNNVNDNANKLEDTFYSISNAEVVPVDDIVRTVISIDKKKK